MSTVTPTISISSVGPSIPPVWLYWTLHIAAWVIGVLAPLLCFFIAKSKENIRPKYDGL